MLCDVAQKTSTIIKKDASEKSLASFSADGSLLIISSCNNNSIIHDYFDTFSLKSWSKQTAGQLLAVGNGKSIEQTEGLLYYSPRCVTLVDDLMNKSLQLITDENPSPCVEHPLEINTKLKNLFENHISTYFPYPISPLLYARNSTEQPHRLLLIHPKYKPFVFGAVLLAVVAGMYRMMHRSR